MFEREAEEYVLENFSYDYYGEFEIEQITEYSAFQKGAEYGYNKANEWFDARTSIPVPKKAEIYRYTLEVISDKGDIVCYDYKDKGWKELVIDNEKVTYVPIEIEKWCNRPTKEIE